MTKSADVPLHRGLFNPAGLAEAGGRRRATPGTGVPKTGAPRNGVPDRPPLARAACPNRQSSTHDLEPAGHVARLPALEDSRAVVAVHLRNETQVDFLGA